MTLKLWTCALAAGLSAQAIAQTASMAAPAIPADQVVTAANGVTARCMARMTTQSENPNWSFVVPVPDSAQADFSAKGFQPASCAGLGVELTKFKADACDLARGNEAVQRRNEQVFGIDARKVCAAIKQLIPDGASTQSN
jgi:hypothetical protein